MASLTVKSFAEMINLPAHEQAKIIFEQKHPKKEPQIFRTPFYQPALTAIGRFYREGRDLSHLKAALSNIQNLPSAPRRQNNARVIQSFESCPLAVRQFSLMRKARITALSGNVELRLSPDFFVSEDEEPKLVYLNCRAEKLNPETARLIAEVAHWVADQNELGVPISSIEVVDLFTGARYTFNSPRKSTTKKLEDTSKVIGLLWDGIG